MDYRRLAINLFFFFLGILIPLLAFQSAFASYASWESVSNGISGGTCYYIYNSSEPYGELWVFYDIVSCSSDIATHGIGICEEFECTEPETWNNGIKDPDEEGIDCGGENPAICDTEGCPPGTDYFMGGGCFPTDPPWEIYTDSLQNCAQGTVNVGSDGSPKICVPYQIVPDADGNCREGYDIAYELSHGQQLCGPSTVLYSSEDLPPTMEEYSLESENAGFQNASLSVVEYENTEITDNGDGTSTKVETSTRSGSDGSSQTSTKTSTVDNSTGDTLASSTNTETETPPEDNPENYNYDIGSYELPGEEYDTLPDEKDLDSIFDQVQTWNPFSDADDRWKIVTSGSSCTLETNISFLGSHTLGFSLCEFQWAFNAIGVVMVFGAYLVSFYIVTKGR